MSLSKVRQMRESDGAGEIERHRPCSICRTATLSATLSQYGARCHSCYERYLTEGTKPETADKRTDGPKAWAWFLRSRELAGARLSPTQRSMWRECLRFESVDGEQVA